MRILFFDTETSGLPKNWNAPVEQLENWPRLVQIAWQVYDLQGKLIAEEEYVIKPNGFEIPIEASNVHKITTQKAHETGVDLSLILDIFSNVIMDSDLLVAHNYSFDYSIIGAELLRNGLENTLINKDNICTMKSSTDFCKISGPFGNKWPKLEELYDILFNETFNAHDALDDIRATARCFWELQKKNIIKITSSKEIEVHKTSNAIVKSEITFSKVAPSLEKEEQELNNKNNVAKLHEIDIEEWNIQLESANFKSYNINDPRLYLYDRLDHFGDVGGDLGIWEPHVVEYNPNPTYDYEDDGSIAGYGFDQEHVKFTGSLICNNKLYNENIKYYYFNGVLIQYKHYSFGRLLRHTKLYDGEVWSDIKYFINHDNTENGEIPAALFYGNTSLDISYEYNCTNFPSTKEATRINYRKDGSVFSIWYYENSKLMRVESFDNNGEKLINNLRYDGSQGSEDEGTFSLKYYQRFSCINEVFNTWQCSHHFISKNRKWLMVTEELYTPFDLDLVRPTNIYKNNLKWYGCKKGLFVLIDDKYVFCADQSKLELTLVINHIYNSFIPHTNDNYERERYGLNFHYEDLLLKIAMVAYNYSKYFKDGHSKDFETLKNDFQKMKDELKIELSDFESEIAEYVTKPIVNYVIKNESSYSVKEIHFEEHEENLKWRSKLINAIKGDRYFH
jgi:DNA polymerase-3 subunit epsilon